MAVNYHGSVTPVKPQFGSPNNASLDGVDDDSDNIVDWIDSQGNNTPLANPSGSDPSDWDNAIHWVDWSSAFNAEIGKLFHGYLEINGGTVLRMQHLVGGRGGFGHMVLTGVGSRWASVDMLDADIQSSVAFASATSTSGSYDPDAVTLSDLPDATKPVAAQIDDETATANYDVFFGHTHACLLEILAGARCEARNRFRLGNGSHARVDGSGSILHAAHKAAVDAGGTPTDAMHSRVDEGSVLEISNGGTVVMSGAKLDIEGRLLISSGHAAIDGDVILDGVCRVRGCATLRINGAWTGDGKIVLDPGADVAGEVPEEMVVRPGALPLTIVANEVESPS